MKISMLKRFRDEAWKLWRDNAGSVTCYEEMGTVESKYYVIITDYPEDLKEFFGPLQLVYTDKLGREIELRYFELYWKSIVKRRPKRYNLNLTKRNKK